MIGKLKQMTIFIGGLQGLGIETAKNLILAGPHTVAVHDDGLCTVADLGTNFYLNEDAVGKPRGQSCLTQLRDLNPNINVKLLTGPITCTMLATFSVVVFINATPLRELRSLNAFCRSQQIVFLYAYNRGATAGLFADFGQAHPRP